MRFYLRALSYFRRDTFPIVCVLALIGLSVCVGTLQAWPMGIMADAITLKTQPTDWIHRIFQILTYPFPHSKLGQVIGIAVVGMLLKTAQDSIALSKNMLNNFIKYNGNTRARLELFEKLESLGPDYHGNKPQGDALYRVTNDVWGLFGILDGFIATGASVVTLVAMTAVMLSRNWRITLVAWSAGPMLMLVNYFYSRTLKRTALDTKRVDTDFTTVLQRAMSHISLTQLFGRQKDEKTRFEGVTLRSVRALLRFNWQEQFYPLAVQSIFALWGAAVFGYGGYLVYRDTFVHPNPNGFHISDVIAFMAYLGQLWDPLSRIIGFKAGIQGHVASAERVFYVLDQPISVTDAPGAIRLKVRPRALSLNDVSFRYAPDAKLVLRDLSARIQPGQMVAFIGPSGTGKSTLLSLLPRLHDPTSGFLALDEYDLRQVRVADVRAHIALVPQESTMLAASVADNISYGRPNATRRQIVRAAAMAGAADFIESFPEGYDTLITEGGQNLSGGQRQRIAIARALLTEAPILVFDEPTSALDLRHEQLIMEMLTRLRRSRTVVLVTHRLETVVDCDQIFVMSAGRIVEHGTHEQLLERGEHYRLPVRAPRAVSSISTVA